MRAIVLAAAVLALAGCGGEERTKPEKPAAAKSAKPPPEPPPATPRWPRRARCAAGAANCTSARGTVVFVEAVDPDGDGDAHFVLASATSLSGPGITAIDVKRELRPKPLPRIGDRVSAAGPVYRGSYGQRQIEATELFVARR